MPPRVNPNSKKVSKNRKAGSNNQPNVLKGSDEGREIGGLEGSEKAVSASSTGKKRAQIKRYVMEIMKAYENQPEDIINAIIEANVGDLMVKAGVSLAEKGEGGTVMDHEHLAKFLSTKASFEVLSDISSELKINVRKQIFENGVEIEFQTIYVNSEDILEKTVVSKINPRGYASQDPNEISEIEVADVMKTIDENQESSVIGFMGKDGLIHIVDGSRRRLACIKADVALRIDLADKEIDVDTLSYIIKKTEEASESRRDHNPVEKGFLYKGLLDLGLPLEKVMERYSIEERSIRDCIKLSEISDRILDLAYSRSTIGRPLLIVLKNIEAAISSMTDEEQEQVWNQIIEKRNELLDDEKYQVSYIKHLDIKKQRNTIKNNNKTLVQGIKAYLEEIGVLAPKKAKKESKSIEKIGKYKPVLSKSLGRKKMKVEVKSGKEGSNEVSLIKFTNFSSQDLEDALEYIQKKHSEEQAVEA